MAGMSVLMRSTVFPRCYSSVRSLSRGNDARTTSLRFFSESEHKVRKKDVSPETMLPTYDPNSTEAEWYNWWESMGYFQPNGKGKLFAILLPPPNVTGTLHLGHALTITIQDVYVRWLRMKGHNVLWIPGFDHAGIATQVVVEKYLTNMLNLTRFDLGREEFNRKVSEWKADKEEVIIRQMRQMGASVDWTKKYFTLDPIHSEAVTQAFIRLHNKGLIHRLNRLVNWSCYLKSGISDIEVEWRELEQPCKIHVPDYRKAIEFGFLYKFAYKIINEDDEVIVATTRPETMLGDTAVAVHPEDSRYSHLRNKFAWHPFRECKIPIIFDETVKMDFGTGAVKMTPAHSPEDFEIGERHRLEVLDVFDESGAVRKTELYVKFQGMKRYDAREQVLNELNNLGLYRGKESHATVVPVCSRSGDIIEFLRKPQWFLKCGEITRKVREAILNGDVEIEPDYCKDVLFEWFKHGKDWNLSRQLWWGHRIPMYECRSEEGENLWVSAASAEEALKKASEKLETDESNVSLARDPDVLDTWFSSAMLPLSAAGWPGSGVNDGGIYPLGLLETGQDIAFFWVARMLMLGIELTDQVPFKKVVLHGLVCDGLGRKMSKSLGNVVLPEDVIRGTTLREMKLEAEKNYRRGILSKNELNRCLEGHKKLFPSGIPECGADALRLALCKDKFKGDFLNFSVDFCKSNRHFCNKMWQTMQFLLRHARDRENLSARLRDDEFSLFEKWIFGSLAETVGTVDSGISGFNYHAAVAAIQNFFVKHLCDIYLENTKLVLSDGSREDCQRNLSTIFNCMETSFRLLAPFMPFVTEELYHSLPRLDDFEPCESVTVAAFPDRDRWSRFADPKVDDLMSKFTEILFALRSMRSVYKLSKQRLKVVLNCPSECEDLFRDELTRFLKKHASIEDISRVSGDVSDRNVITQVVEDCTIHLYHEHDRDALREIFASVLVSEGNLRECLDKLNSTMSDPNYEADTPIEVRRKNSLALATLAAKIKKIEELKKVIDKAR